MAMLSTDFIYLLEENRDMHKQGGNDLLHWGDKLSRENLSKGHLLAGLSNYKSRELIQRRWPILIYSLFFLFHVTIKPLYSTWRTCRYVCHCAQACLMRYAFKGYLCKQDLLSSHHDSAEGDFNSY